MSPTYFVTVIISLVIWPIIIFLLAVFAISLKSFVLFLKSPKYFGHFSISPFFATLFFHHQVLVLFLYHQN